MPTAGKGAIGGRKGGEPESGGLGSKEERKCGARIERCEQ